MTTIDADVAAANRNFHAQVRKGDHRRAAVPRIAVLIPCFNESLTIAKVVQDFSVTLPEAEIYVYDNNSTDGTIEAARSAGACVRSEPKQGKGNVVRRMFADIEADVFVLVDGDDTYEARIAPHFVQTLVRERLDFLNGIRVPASAKAYRPGHQLGNWLLTRLISWLFGRQFTDMLSGYKLFSKRFVKSFPVTSSGFEIETELTVHALQLRMPACELPTSYADRPPGSESKLKTYRDGFRILFVIARLLKDERPLLFFGSIGAVLVIAAVTISIPVLATFVQTGLVPRLPTAVLSTGMVILGVLALAVGMILDMTRKMRLELKRLFYLSIQPYDIGNNERNPRAS
jgi:glycosyltransferase involved in cell wall biosynthesis